MFAQPETNRVIPANNEENIRKILSEQHEFALNKIGNESEFVGSVTEATIKSVNAGGIVLYSRDLGIKIFVPMRKAHMSKSRAKALIGDRIKVKIINVGNSRIKHIGEVVR